MSINGPFNMPEVVWPPNSPALKREEEFARLQTPLMLNLTLIF